MNTEMEVKEGRIEHSLDISIARHSYPRLPKVAPNPPILLTKLLELEGTAPVDESNSFEWRFWVIEVRNHGCNRLKADQSVALHSQNVGPRDACGRLVRI